MQDILIKFPVILKTGYEVEMKGEENEEKVAVKVPQTVEKELVIKPLSMDEYFESSKLNNQKEIWAYVLDKQLVTPADLKNIDNDLWKLNIRTLKYVVSMCVNFTLEPYAERWLPFHTSYAEITGI